MSKETLLLELKDTQCTCKHTVTLFVYKEPPQGTFKLINIIAKQTHKTVFCPHLVMYKPLGVNKQRIAKMVGRLYVC